jgi:hypothetical protein
MENYQVILEHMEDEDLCGYIKFTQNDIIVYTCEFDLDELGDFYENNNLSDGQKITLLENFVDNLKNNNDTQLDFKQTNGIISIAYKSISSNVSFELSQMTHGSKMVVNLTDELTNVFSDILMSFRTHRTQYQTG